MEFKINDMNRNAETGLVHTVHWICTKTDGDAVASVYSSMAVEPSDDFVDYASLTEAIVIDWVKAKLDLVSVEASLDAQIAEQKTPTVLNGVPW